MIVSFCECGIIALKPGAFGELFSANDIGVAESLGGWLKVVSVPQHFVGIEKIVGED